MAIQKKAPDYNPDRGAKWPLTSLRRYLNQSRGNEATEAAFKRVNDVFWYSLQAVQEQGVLNNSKNTKNSNGTYRQIIFIIKYFTTFIYMFH